MAEKPCAQVRLPAGQGQPDDADPCRQHGRTVTAPATVRPRRRHDPDRKTRIVDAVTALFHAAAGADSL